MRIYLTVRRNRLEPVDLVWSIPEYASRSAVPTISRLLSSVDEVVPLESNDWGLEDYMVQIEGFECLHYARLEDVLQNGDHVM
jgi:hypothetical protein